MAITTPAGIVDGLGNSAQQFITNKASIAAQVAGGFSALWRATGVPAQGAIPTVATILNNTVLGGFMYSDAPIGKYSYIGRAFQVCGNAATDVQYHDRLAHMGGLSGTVTTAQSVNLDVSGTSANLEERRGAVDYSDVQWWLEWYATTGATAVTATVTYTNAAGASGRTVTVAIPGSTAASRMIPLFGLNGEFMQSIQSITHPTTGTAGNYGITATRVLTTISCGLANAGTVADWAYLGLPRVPNQSCVTMVVLAGTTSTGVVIGSAKLIQG